MKKRTKNEIVLHEDFAEFFFTNMKGEKKRATFSTKDYWLVKKHQWYIHGEGYMRAKINGKWSSFHRMIMSCPENLEVDHIDRDPSNNRRSNLRIVTGQQNKMNNARKGVSFRERDGVWRSYIRIDGKNYEKTFKTEEEAIIHREKMKKELFGEYAYYLSI